MLDIFDIIVLCVVPSYTRKDEVGCKLRPFYEEVINGVGVLRILEFDKNKKLSRISDIVSYYIDARKATRRLCSKPFDYVFMISYSPLLGGWLIGSLCEKKAKKNG